MTSPFERALHEQLVSAARRDLDRAPNWRRLLRRVIASVAAVAGIALGVGSLASSPAGANIRITVSHERVDVLLTHLIDEPAEVQAAFARAGLSARVEGVPTGPSAVGRFVGLEGTLPTSLVDADGASYAGFSFPVGTEGDLIIYLGRPAAPGEEYGASSDAFGRGEPLECSGLLGGRLEDAEALVAGFVVRVQSAIPGLTDGPIPLDEALHRNLGSKTVVGGQMVARDHVVLSVGDPVARQTTEDC